MNKFEVISSNAYCNGEKYTSYGLLCSINGETFEIADITEDKSKIEFIANSFNAHKPDKVHIYDILENYLIDFEDF